MVGGEDQVSKVIDLLVKSDSNLEVISITGMVGSGKTTLARRVFKHSIIESLFSLRAFVSVPQEYNDKKINVLLEILRQFGQEEEIYGQEEAELVEILGNCLNNSSFLIVLDDVCSPQVLDDIRSLLLAQPQQGNQENQKKGLLAVRNRKMGIYEKNEYELPLLDLSKSRELLRMEIFGERDKKCPVELEGLETKILEKCHNLPLAIVSVARILARRRNKIEWWKKVAEHVNVFTERESLINKAIRAIFDGLNDNLKLCFLYLGLLFNKDFEIPVRVLLRLWMAEGLVGEGEEGNGNDKSIEQVAEDYLEELVDRNLLWVNQRRSNGKIKWIRIHDGLHDFCKSEAKEENIFRESFFSETCRRICIRDSLVSQFQNSVPKSTTPTYSLRSILYFTDDPFISSSNNNIPKPLFKVIFNNVTKPFRKNRTKPSGILPDGESFPLFLSWVPKTFKLLRVLEVSSFMLTELPTALFSLFLLRYVAVSCQSSFLPMELSNLSNLQTLIILTFSEWETLEIRADLRDMPSLRHIHSNKSILLRKLKKGEKKIGNGSVIIINENLRTISRISPKSCTKELFQKIPNLETLVVSGKLSMEGGNNTNNNKHNFFDHIVELNRLRNLKLLNDDASSKYVLPPIHSGSFPENLTNLTLRNTYLAGENMSRIGELENLEILKLQRIEFEEGSWESNDGGFRKLRVLHVKVTNLKQWKALGNHFPRLASLFLWHCNNLETLPVGLPDMLCLETVNLLYGHDNLASSLKTILENHPGFELIIYPEYK